MMKSGRDSYMQFFRYFYTLKNMKISQIFAKLVFLYRRRFLRLVNPSMVSSLAEGLKQNIDINGQKKLDVAVSGKNNRLNLEAIVWERAVKEDAYEKELFKCLNSFEWLQKEMMADSMVPLVSYIILDWISKNKNEHSESWEPYSLSMRITAWTRWLRKNPVPLEVSSIIRPSINLQLRRLFSDLEYYNPTSHLLENLRAFITGCHCLILARQYFNNEREYQLEVVVEELIKQIKLQFLPDGAHFERTPMCHAKALELVKEVREIASKLNKQLFLLPSLLDDLKKLEDLCGNKIAQISNWFELMTMPDGYVSQFNDSEKIQGLKHNFESFCGLLEPSGYFVKHCHDCSFVLSCGEASPAFQPGRSHCDIFSYEFFTKGIRTIIDVGFSGYGNETLRRIARESGSHNIPMVQHQEQSDIWGSFAIGKRARVVKRHYRSEEEKLEIGILDQYGQNIEREIVFSKKQIKINDFLKRRRLEGTFVSLVHLSPEVMPEVIVGEHGETIIGCKMTNEKSFSIITRGAVRIDDYLSFPEVGKASKAKVLILSDKEAEAIEYAIRW